MEHGDKLVNLMLTQQAIDTCKHEIGHYSTWRLNTRQLCDVELLTNGAFSPLSGFMSQADYQSVIDVMRLSDGRIWPMPIVLDVDDAFAANVTTGETIVLLDPENMPLALMKISDCWIPDKSQEAMAVYASDDTMHSGVSYLLQHSGNVYLGGQLQGLGSVRYYDFPHLRHSPRELRQCFQDNHWQHIVGFQTRNPMHRAHQALTLHAMQETGAKLLLHPVVGQTKPGDIDHYSRVRCYEKLLPHYQRDNVILSLLPLAMRMAGPREALWHAIIRKNYGCTHFIIGRDHAGPGNDRNGKAFYTPYAAQELAQFYSKEIGIQCVYSQELVYVKQRKIFAPINTVNDDEEILSISGTAFRQHLNNGETIPPWFSYPDIIEELRRGFQAKHQQGYTIFFTGLSGSGKSTLAKALLTRLLAIGRKVTLLDGDVIRQHLCPELGFSKEDRDLNLQRIGYVASEITKHNGVALCAQIAPYQASRDAVRELIHSVGNFIEIYVSTPLTICEQRDSKGLYAQARAGKIKHFTGISDPYEVPTNPTLTIDTSITSVTQAIEQITATLAELQLICR